MSDLFPCSVTMVSKCPQGSISIPKGSRWKRGWGGREGDLLERGSLEMGLLQGGVIKKGIFRKAFFFREGFITNGSIRMGFIKQGVIRESFFSERVFQSGFFQGGVYQRGLFREGLSGFFFFLERVFLGSFQRAGLREGVRQIISDKLKQSWRLVIFFCVSVWAFTIFNTSHLFFRTGTFGSVLQYGCERKISEHSTLTATMSIGIPTGVVIKIK